MNASNQIGQGLGVIFDMDGVLVNSYQAHLKSWRNAGLRHGLTMTDQNFNHTFGRTSKDIIEFLWPGEFTPPQAETFDQEKEADYRRLIRDDFPEMDGAADLIAALHAAGFVLAIGSSGPPENVAVVREKIRNGKFISAAVDRTYVTRGKPDPEVFIKAAQQLKLPPNRCAVIEDAPVGVQAARRAGAAAIGLLGTAPREKLMEFAHLVVASLRELTPQIIAQQILSLPVYARPGILTKTISPRTPPHTIRAIPRPRHSPDRDFPTDNSLRSPP